MKTVMKSGAGTLFTLLALLLAGAGTGLYIINASGSYYHDFQTTVVILGSLGMALMLVLLLLTHLKGERVWMDGFYPAAAMIFAAAAIVFVSHRVESAGIILGSDLEAGNAAAMAALMQSFLGSGCLLGAALMTGISSFFRQGGSI